MIDLIEAIKARGHDEAEAHELAALLDSHGNHEATNGVIQAAAELVHRIFLRVGLDSLAGCALRRALGFSNDTSLSRAARDFQVSKQALHHLQTRLESQLGDLSFLARAARQAPSNSVPPDSEILAGPLGEDDDSR